MDRNTNFNPVSLFDLPVALRKESVDRNFDAMQIVVVIVQSLSARRAWIEISKIWYCGTSIGSLSARRAWIEIIDDLEPSKTRRSLSARRAWIEIMSDRL